MFHRTLPLTFIIFSSSLAGQFGPQQVIDVQGSYTVCAGDLDGDGDNDVVAGVYGLSWYANDGSGLFGLPNLITDSLYTLNAAIADIDSDGDPDVLRADDWGHVMWFPNDGAGHFGDPITAGGSGLNSSLTAADMDGDGDLDVIAGGGSYVAFMRNIGGGVFDEQVNFNGDVSGGFADVGDLDGDGDPDVASSSSGNGTLAWYRNEGMGQFSNEIQLSITQWGLQFVYCRDMDGDGDIDLLTGNYDNGAVRSNANDGAGNFTLGDATLNANYCDYGCPADFDQDGDLDLAWSSELDDRIQLIVQDGYWGLMQADTITTETDWPFQLFAADLDGDDDPDLLSVSLNDQKLAWYENLNTSLAFTTFREARIILAPNPFSTTATLSLNSPLGPRDHVSILDAQGRTVRELPGRGSTAVILERAELTSGMYTLIVVRAGVREHVGSFVIE